jgi:hypothetical protein
MPAEDAVTQARKFFAGELLILTFPADDLWQELVVGG